MLPGLALLLLAAAWTGAYAWGNSTSGRAFLKERAEQALRKRLGPVEVGDARLDILLQARLAPIAVLRDEPSRPLVRAAAVVVRPRLSSLLRGKVEPAVVRMEAARYRPGQGDAEIGPVDLTVEFPEEGTVRVRVTLPGRGAVDLTVRRDERGMEIQAQGEVVLPDDLPQGIAARLPFRPASGTLSFQVSARIPPGGRTEADIEIRAASLSIDGPLVGAAPLGPVTLGARGHLEWDRVERRFRLREGTVTLGEAGEARAGIEAEATLQGAFPFALSVVVPPVRWDALVEALPQDLGPPPSAPPVSGTLAARGSISGLLSRREEWNVQVDLDLDDLRRASRAAGATWLASPFEWTPIDLPQEGKPRRILVGPGNPLFVPYGEIPQVVVRAVTASEDGGFFGHRGFEFREIANAIADRSRVRGASTLTQQLSKNLFLSPERTLARKVREALGTIALEANLPKARLAEIYLNIAEWGPDVYGVGEAARFWFGKDARELTARESAFLATVLPSPRRFHAGLHRHGLTARWNGQIDVILSRMRIQGAIDDVQLDAARTERLEGIEARHPLGTSPGDVTDPGPADPEGADPAEADYLSR